MNPAQKPDASTPSTSPSSKGKGKGKGKGKDEVGKLCSKRVLTTLLYNVHVHARVELSTAFRDVSRCYARENISARRFARGVHIERSFVELRRDA